VLTQLQKIQLLDKANIECNWGNPGSKLIDSPEWAQIITPRATHSASNAVYRSVLTEANMHSKVDETIAFYTEMKVPYRWLITPLSTPTKLPELLEQKGMIKYYEASGMLASVDSQITDFDSSIRIQKVSIDDLDVYVETFAKAWELPSHQIPHLRQDVQYGLGEGAGRFIPFVAFKNDIPVGTCALLNIPSGGYLAAGTVVKEHRGQGIYKAMLSYRAGYAKKMGHENLLIHAKKHTAAPICQKLGFESVYDYQVYSRE
jgi:Acetyltransferase (GNAT) family.